MGKIAPVSAKYIVHTKIHADGVVEKPDVIGAIFGQTEGLLGTELELRELQKNGRIGRIEVNLNTNNGKTDGEIIIPSSLDMAETAVVASALETIQRIGPCNAKLNVESIEDVRVTKRTYVVDRAKELLKGMIDKGPESAEIMEEIKEAVRTLEIQEYGPERLPAGPGIKESEELVIVEGRADVIALLKNGFKNVIALQGTSVPKTVADLSRQKTTTLFVDGDRGGKLIVKELISAGELDFVAIAPSGKEVEELTKKEINKCLRARMPIEQYKEEMAGESEELRSHTPRYQQRPQQTRTNRSDNYDNRDTRRDSRAPQRFDKRQQFQPKPPIPKNLSGDFKKMLEELIGTRGAYLLDKDQQILGKVPSKELKPTLQNLPDVDAIIMDDEATPDTIRFIENSGVTYLIAMDAKGRGRKLKVVTAKEIGIA
ncbi:MAG TPA: DNA primase [Candidatus Woesearchaeota archaeon]|nr:DNA primase [Candidatus Woesearchaeota archaeon]